MEIAGNYGLLWCELSNWFVYIVAATERERERERNAIMGWWLLTVVTNEVRGVALS